MRDEFPFLNLFDGLLISGEDKLIKPSKEIYELAISRFDLIPEETIFIDDKFENIQMAKKLSMKTIKLIDTSASWFFIESNRKIERIFDKNKVSYRLCELPIKGKFIKVNYDLILKDSQLIKDLLNV